MSIQVTLDPGTLTMTKEVEEDILEVTVERVVDVHDTRIVAMTNVGRVILWKNGAYTTKKASGWTDQDVADQVKQKIEAGNGDFQRHPIVR